MYFSTEFHWNSRILSGRVGLPMPDLTVRLVQKDEQNNDTIVAEGTYDKVTILQKGSQIEMMPTVK